MSKKQAEKVGKVYYWKRSDGSWAMQIVHTTAFATMEAAPSEAEVKRVAKELGYVAERDNG